MDSIQLNKTCYDIMTYIKDNDDDLAQELFDGLGLEDKLKVLFHLWMNGVHSIEDVTGELAERTETLRSKVGGFQWQSSM